MCWLTFRTHSYSPNFESKVPFCRDRSLSVKRGPSSWMPTFFSFLKIYLHRCKRWQTFQTTYANTSCTPTEALKVFTCGTWRRRNLSGCGKWPPVDRQTVGSVGKELQTIGRCCGPGVCWSCSEWPPENVLWDLCLASAERRHQRAQTAASTLCFDNGSNRGKKTLIRWKYMHSPWSLSVTEHCWLWSVPSAHQGGDREPYRLKKGS